MWTYRLYNSIGLSVRADLYLNGKFSGISSRVRSDVECLKKEAQAVCDWLNEGGEI